jgi:hypothetical protein
MEVKQNFGGVEHFIRGVREIPPPPRKSARGTNGENDSLTLNKCIIYTVMLLIIICNLLFCISAAMLQVL